jgi:hypothetical protein
MYAYFKKNEALIEYTLFSKELLSKEYEDEIGVHQKKNWA